MITPYSKQVNKISQTPPSTKVDTGPSASNVMPSEAGARRARRRRIEGRSPLKISLRLEWVHLCDGDFRKDRPFIFLCFRSPVLRNSYYRDRKANDRRIYFSLNPEEYSRCIGSFLQSEMSICRAWNSEGNLEKTFL